MRTVNNRLDSNGKRVAGVFDVKFGLQIIGFTIAVFVGVLGIMSPSVRATFMGYIPGLPHSMSIKESYAHQDEFRKQLRVAYADLGAFWEDGKAIAPPRKGRSRTGKPRPYGPFFMPVMSIRKDTSKIFRRYVSQDAGRFRFGYREQLYAALMEFSKDRCSARRRASVIDAFEAYRRAYFRSLDRHTIKRDIHYFETRTDLHLVGVLIVLADRGYLTWDDMPPPTIPSGLERDVAGPEQFAGLKPRFEKRRACSG